MTGSSPESKFKFTTHDRDLVRLLLDLLALHESCETKVNTEPDQERAAMYERVGIVVERSIWHVYPAAAQALEKGKP